MVYNLRTIFDEIKKNNATLRCEISKLGKGRKYVIILNKVYSINTIKKKITDISIKLNLFSSFEINTWFITASDANKCCFYIEKI